MFIGKIKRITKKTPPSPTLKKKSVGKFPRRLQQAIIESIIQSLGAQKTARSQPDRLRFEGADFPLDIVCLFFKEILTACLGSCGEKYGKNYRKTAGIHDASCIRSTQQTSFETTSLDDFKSATECCELMAVKGTFGEGCPEAGKLLTFFGDIGACCKGGCGLSQPSRGLSIELNLSRLPLKPQRDSTKNSWCVSFCPQNEFSPLVNWRPKKTCPAFGTTCKRLSEQMARLFASSRQQ